jgi:hypothetical protein
MQYIVTEHAVERFCQRIRPGMPYDTARWLLAELAPFSTPIKERTERGQEKRKIADPECYLICKRGSQTRNERAIVVVTVIEKEDDFTFDDWDIFDEFTKVHAERAIETTANRTVRKFAPPNTPHRVQLKDEVRKFAHSVLEDELTRRLAEFVHSKVKEQVK